MKRRQREAFRRELALYGVFFHYLFWLTLLGTGGHIVCWAARLCNG